MKNTNHSFRYLRWQQQYQKLIQRLEIAMQKGQLDNWSTQKVKQLWRKLQKLSERLKRQLKPALLTGFLGTGLIVKKEALAAILPEENPFAPDAEFRKFPTVYQERAYLKYERAKLDPTGNLDWQPFNTKGLPAYQLNRNLGKITQESTAIHTPIAALALPMQPIQMDNSSDFGANYGIYGHTPAYRLTNPTDPNDPPAAPTQPDLAAESDTGKQGDNVTTNLLPLIQGQAEQNTSITLESNIDGILAANIKVDAIGNWAVRLEQPLSEGQHQIIAKAVNETGTSPASAPLALFTGAGDAQGNGTNNVVTRDNGNPTRNSVVGGGDNNKASADYATVGGGINNQVTSQESTIGGGKSNQISIGGGSIIGGGYLNIITAEDATIGGGTKNQISGRYATISGGYKNMATDFYATIGGGLNNLASGKHTTIGGGVSNLASGNSSTIAGGYENQATGVYSTIGGGYRNMATDDYATIGGGGSNLASGNSSTIAGGYENQATGVSSTIGGGYKNEATANYATIPGGYDLRASSYGETAIGIFNDTTNISPNKTGITATDRLFVIGNGTADDARSNALVMLKNGNTQLNGILSLSNGTDTLALPNTKGNNGQVLTSDGAGQAAWMDANGGAGAFSTTNNVTSNSSGTLGTDDFVFGSDQLDDDDSTKDKDARFFFDKSKAAWRAGKVTGNEWNVDSLGTNSTVAGGFNNKAIANYTTVGGGYNNEATAGNATVGGGNENKATGFYATVGGGKENKATNFYATVGGGGKNKATNFYATVGGGRENKATGFYATVGGGIENKATNSYATVGGGSENMATEDYATIGGGGRNLASGNLSTIAGGYKNQATGVSSTIGGGYKNEATANYATIPGGYDLRATSYGETAIGIFNDTTGISPNKTGITATDRLFVIGNGVDSKSRSNALVMLKNGNTQLNGILSLSNGTDTLALPNTKGNNGQVLTSDGAGQANWMDAGAAGAFSTTNNVTSNSSGTLGTDDFVFGSDSLNNKILTGAEDDARFFFDKSKAAWRAGLVTGNQWNVDSLGSFSTVVGGSNNKATDLYTSVGGGSSNKATNHAATVAGGRQNQAIGYAATIAGGNRNQAAGNNAAVSGGRYNQATADNATVSGGNSNEATASNATVGGGRENIAMGYTATVSGGRSNQASGNYATVSGGHSNKSTAAHTTTGGGFYNQATADHATIGGGRSNKAIAENTTIGGGGYNNATANFATIPGGRGLDATSYGETTIGIYNDTTGITPDKTMRVETDRLFVIGNGVDHNNRSNALIMLKNGNLGLGSPFGAAPTMPTEAIEHANGAKLTASGIWMNASDRSRKTNIQALEYGLAEILKLRAVEYDYKADGSHSIGFIAQELEKILPELVKGGEGNKSVAYSLLTSVLVQAIQEMQVNNEQVVALNEEQELEIDALQTMIHQLQEENAQLKQVNERMAKLENLVGQLMEDKLVSVSKAADKK